MPQRLCGVFELGRSSMDVACHLGHSGFQCTRRPMDGSGHITQPVGARLLLLTGNAARLGLRGFGRLSNVRFRLSAQ